jgi:TolB-like protein/Flp pilus assembly protein TadD
MNGAADIFLSYNREDQATARRFAEAFEREGLSVWWDQTLRSGEAYDQVTEKALREARAVVVLWSKKSVESRWVRAEATLADRNRTLVPAMIEACERPIMFELTQTADLSKWSGEANDRTWLGFLADVHRFVGAGTAQNTASASMPGPAPVARQNGGDGRPSLAILPFANRSGERADDVFADGMVEDLVSALSLNDGLKVIANSATQAYRKSASDLRSIGRDLGVRYLLEGNVRRVGESLRVTAQLVEAENGVILWSKKFDRPLVELADLQERLVSEVAGHLGVQVLSVETERSLRKPGDLTAWEAVMRALAAAAEYTGPGSGSNSIAEARKAIAISPDYALGHAVLSAAIAHNFMATGGRDQALRREGLQHVERALVLSQSDAGVLGPAAIALCTFGLWQDGLLHARRAVELNPNLVIGRNALAIASMRAGLPDDAIASFEVVESLAPRGAIAFLALGLKSLAYFQKGQYEQALDAGNRAIRLRPGFVLGFANMAVFCEKLGLHEAARQAIRQLREAAPVMTPDEIEMMNRNGFLPPEATADLNLTLRKAWLDTPMDSP